MNKTLLVVPLILLSLIIAVWSGWIRMGWALPLPNATGHHGAAMVGSFLASLIFLERAVTFKNKTILLLPFINAISIIGFLAGYALVAQALLIAGSLGFLTMCGYFIYQYKELYYYLFLAGAFCLLTGNVILFKTHFYPNAVTWWMGFFLFTIVAERIELSRFLALTFFKKSSIIGAAAAVFISLFFPFHYPGNILLAIAISATAVWLLKYDMAWRSLKIKGQHRYSASLLITGYVWLLITAVLLVVGNRFAFYYDAALHSFFIGFVFSMIFSHAPIILPAVLKLPVKLFRPILYVWFVLLQASLIVRIGGDVLENTALRKGGAMANGIVFLVFFATVAFIVRVELAKRKTRLRPS